MAAAEVLIWLVVALRSVLLQFLIAIILATGLAPLKRRPQQRGLPNLLATLLIFIGLLLLGVGIVALLLPALLQSAELFIAQAPTLARELQQQMQGLLQRFPFLSPLGQELAAQLRSLAGVVATASTNVTGFVSTAVLSTFLTSL